jgi:hypothetical protein
MASETEAAGWGLVVSFGDLYQTMPEEHAFCHGVEFGCLWARMKSGTEAEIEGTFHSENKTVIERACASQGWSVTFEPSLCDGIAIDGWLTVKMKKTKAATHNPHGLRVVSQNKG